MAKNNPGSEDRAKVKFRFIEFELEGGNAAVENSVRNLTHALTQKNGATVGPKPLPLKTTPAVLTVMSGSNNDGTEQETTTTEEASEELESGTQEPAVVKAARATRKPPVPEVVDIDLTSGDKPFREYCESKSLETDWKKYLACALWLKEYRNMPTITDDHIYTMFKFMKWSFPADVAAPLRAMKKHGWFTTPERGKYAINHLGENEVNRMAASA